MTCACDGASAAVGALDWSAACGLSCLGDGASLTDGCTDSVDCAFVESWTGGENPWTVNLLMTTSAVLFESCSVSV